MNGGTLRTTQNLRNRAPSPWARRGSVEPQAGTTLTLASSIGGAGSLTKLGDGTAILTGSNSYGSGLRSRMASRSSRRARCRWAMAAPAATSWVPSAMKGCWRSTARTAMSRPRRSRAAASWSSGAAARPCSMPSTPHTGGTTVTAGALAVGDASHAGAAINGGAVTVQGGATFGGYGSVKGDVSNAGTLAVADALPGLGGGAGAFAIAGNLSNSGLVNLAGANPGNRLTVTGNYQGQSGALSLNAYLARTLRRPTLVVDGGAATGATALRIINRPALASGPPATASRWCRCQRRHDLVRRLHQGSRAPMPTCCSVAASLPARNRIGTCARRSSPPANPGRSTGRASRSMARCRRWLASWRCSRSAPSTTAGARGAVRRSPGGWARTWGDHLSEGSGGMAGSSFSGNTRHAGR